MEHYNTMKQEKEDRLSKNTKDTININLEPGMRKRLKLKATEEGITMTAVVLGAVRKYLTPATPRQGGQEMERET